MRELKARLPWRLGKLFRAYYDRIIDEPLPDRWIELIHALNDWEQLTRMKDAGADTDAGPVSKDR